MSTLIPIPLKNPYHILGLDSSATKEEIKKAYRQLAQRYHPDNGKRAEAKRFAQVAEAYRLLKGGEVERSNLTVSALEKNEKADAFAPHQNLYRERIDPQRKKQQEAFYRARMRQAVAKTSVFALLGGGVFWSAGQASQFYPLLGLLLGLLLGGLFGAQRFFDLPTFLPPKLLRWSRGGPWVGLGLGALYIVGMALYLLK